MRILIVDDEYESLVALKRLFERRVAGKVDIASNGKEALKLLEENNYDIVLLDLIMPDLHGLDVLEKSKLNHPDTEFIILSAVDEIQTAVKAVKLGAYDYLAKPTEPERIFLTVDRAYEYKGLVKRFAFSEEREKQNKLSKHFAKIITQDKKMKELLAYAEVMAGSGNPIMITGDSGTGKELLARAIHDISQFSGGPFVPVNVASVPDSLFESQFFGHVEGAFTGAKNFEGYFRQANKGTLFLDEIGEMPYAQQAKFLRVLEENLITPLGGSKSSQVSVRVISATNIDIQEACKNKKFRLDLLYRLKSAHIHLPPLSERVYDIPLLANHFIKRFSEKHNKPVASISEEAMQYLMQREYEGNIRELSQVIENAILIAETKQISIENFDSNKSLLSLQDGLMPTIKENTLNYVKKVIDACGGDKKKAAEILGISLRQVQRLTSISKD